MSIIAGAVLLVFGYLASPPIVWKCVGDAAWRRNFKVVQTIYAPVIVLDLERRVPLYRRALELEVRLLGDD